MSAIGCAHEKLRFEDAGFDAAALEPDDVAPPAPPAKVPAPRRRAVEQVPPGPPVDGALMAFAAEARSRRGRTAKGHGFPAEAVRAWLVLDDEVLHYLARPLPQTPIEELVRARVTLETELELDRRHYGPEPPEVASRLDARMASLRTRIAAARALGKSFVVQRPPGKLRWPVEYAGVSSPFGMRYHPIDHVRKMHYGVDLAAERGRVVAASAKGYVIQAGWSNGYGLMVEVRHGGDLTTRYSLLSRVLCNPGDAIEEGQPVGLVGSTGKSTGPHLHFEVWSGGAPQDPLALLNWQVAGAAGN